MENILDNIALSYRTDKASKYHNYTKTYWNLFKDLRYNPVTLLELGIGDINSENREGQSLNMWSEFFPIGKIYGIDIDLEKVSRYDTHPKITTFWADQTSKIELESIAQKTNGFDIVIDDASHIQSKTIASFEILWPWVRSKGFYIVEDTVTSYWYNWEGGLPFNFDNNTIMNFAIDSVTYLNLLKQHTHNPPTNYTIPEYVRTLDSVTFVNGMIIFRKI